MTVEHVTFAQLPSWIKASLDKFAPVLIKRLVATAHRGRAEILRTINNTRGVMGGKMVHPPVDRGTYRASWQVEKEERGAYLFSDAPHAAFIERGTRPHWPPLGPILAWVRRKRLVADLKGVAGALNKMEAEAQIARNIQRKIAARGTPPLRILERTLPQIEKILDEEIQAGLKEATG